MAKLRRDIFDMVSRTLEGIGLLFLRKDRFRLAPEQAPGSRLSRITPLDLVNPESDLNYPTLKQEMERAWENDWSSL